MSNSPFNPQHRKESLSGQITVALYRISQAINHILRERATADALSPTQLQTLLFLRFARPGVKTIGGLAQRLGSTYATASGVVDALESKRLVNRQPQQSDRRTTTLTLTESGRQQAAELDHLLDEIEQAIIELPATEQVALQHATQAIVRRLQQAGHVHVYEMCWGCQFFRRNAHPENPAGPHHCAYVNAPLSEPDTYTECPDFVPSGE